MDGKAFGPRRAKAKGLYHADTVDAFRKILRHRVIRVTNPPVEHHQRVGLASQERNAQRQQRQRHQPQPQRPTAQQADRQRDNQTRLEHLTPEIDQRIAQLVGVAGHPRHHFTHAVAPVIGKIQPLDLRHDPLAQAGKQLLPDRQRQQPRAILHHGAGQRQRQQQPHPEPRACVIQRITTDQRDQPAAPRLLHRVADQHLLADHRGIDQREQQRRQREAPWHLAIDRQTAQQRTAGQPWTSRNVRGPSGSLPHRAISRPAPDRPVAPDAPAPRPADAGRSSRSP